MRPVAKRQVGSAPLVGASTAADWI